MTVSENGFLWEAETVLGGSDRSESLAWALVRAGIRFVSFSPRAEQEEVSTFLKAVNWAQTSTDEYADDLLASLWTADLQHIRYKAGETGAAKPEAPEPDLVEPSKAAAPARRTAPEVRAQLEADVRPPAEHPDGTAPESAKAVDLELYESTLYFLDKGEISYLRAEVEREYEQDLGRSAVSLLYDTFEL